ncbi:hypothetical protein Rhal01_02613 [Rubritalea halochordaticola]|uniref:Uncharacterized protein n=1 Tax=Rubritalea halochordaticola TaxID=714537 RepID=A0ABP9V359_9BACT
MNTYQILFHGYGFDVVVDGESGAISGFYTTRRIKAGSPEEAYLAALSSLKEEEKTKALMDESLSNGGQPNFDAEHISEVSLLNRLFGRSPKGFIFYSDSEEPENESSNIPN